MIIAKNGGNDIPSWMVSSMIGKDIDLKASAPIKVDDSNETQVMKSIEKCVKNGKPFYYDASIDDASKSKISELAELAGLSKSSIIPADSSSAKTISSAFTADPVDVKRQSKVEQVDITKSGFADPNSFVKNNIWDSENSIKSKKLDETPSILGTIRSIRGGDDYNVSPSMNPKTGEASIVSPDVKGVNDKTQSTKSIIEQESKSRRDNIVFDKVAWEAEKISSVNINELPRGGISSQGGAATNTNQATPIGQISIGTKIQVADSRMDTGELIRKENESKLNAIRRPREDGKDWDSVSSSVPNKVSDLFFDSLKKAMGANNG